MATINLNNVYIQSSYSIVGPMENNGPLRDYFDYVYEEPVYYNVYFENLRGDNEDWIYNNEERVFSLNTDSLADTDYTVKWELNGLNEETNVYDIGLSEDTTMSVGIIVGIVGGILASLAYPIYNAIVKAKRKKLAPEIIRLTDELMK